MSKLTDKIEQLLEWAGPTGDCMDSVQSILADVRELERSADEGWARGGPENMRRTIHAAKREAYTHARTLFCSHQRMKDGLLALNKAIAALDTEAGSDE